MKWAKSQSDDACSQHFNSINPSGTKGLVSTPVMGGGGGGGESLQYLKNDKCYKPKILRGVRGICQGLRKCQVDITAFAW